MKKTMNYLVYILMAVCVEFLLLRIFSYQLQFSLEEIGVFVIVVMSFLFYRFFIDWNFFSNGASKALKTLAIREDTNSKTVYSSILGALVFLANLNLVHTSPLRLFVVSMLSIMGVWYFANIIRELGNILVAGGKKWTSKNSLSQSQKQPSL
jgi:hypothetical protein